MINSIFFDSISIFNKQQKRSICKIEKENGETATGFLCKIPNPDIFHLMPVFITCYHVISNKDIIERKKIKLRFNDDEIKTIEINNKRKIFTSDEKKYDIIIIEIISDDGFNNENFLDIDDLLFEGDNLNNNYKENNSIYLIHYPKGFKPKLSFGIIKSIQENNYEVEHLCSTDKGSSGSPIFNLSNFKIIGVHKGDHKKFQFKVGTALREPINDFNANINIFNFKNNINSKLDINVINNIIIRKNSSSFDKDYKTISLIFEGYFKDIYKVQSTKIDIVRVAAKINEKKFLSDVINIKKSLDHPIIEKLFEYYKSNKSNEKIYCFIKELCKEGDLFDEIKNKGPLNEQYTSFVIYQIILAVYYCHINNIMVRYIPIENIVITEKINGYPIVKISSFGHSTKYKKDEFKKAIVGASYYIAPEVLKHKYNEKCDIHSCGVIMYILLSGRPPFGGKNDNEILDNIVKGHIDFKSSPFDKISKNGLDLLNKLLEYDYVKRISAKEALNHPWFKEQKSRELFNEIKDKIIVKNILDNIKKYKKGSIIQQIALAYLVHNFPQIKDVVNSCKIFNQINFNQDGKIVKEELFIFLKKFDNEENIEELVIKIFKNLDINNKGFITYKEFIMASVNKKEFLNENNLKFSFSFFDIDKDGDITIDDLKNIFKEVNIDKDINLEEELKSLISEVDNNNNGKISFEKFSEEMKKLIY